PEDAKFLVPDGVREHFRDGIGRRGAGLRDTWMDQLEVYRARHPGQYDEVVQMLRRELPEGWDRELAEFPADPKGLATRESSGQVLNAVASNVPWVIGGSSDLGPSTKTRLTMGDAGDLQRETPGGRNLHFGIREQAMGAIVNGLALTKVRAFGSGFF